MVVSILLYGCTTWTLTKRLKKKLDGNYTRMLRAILNKSWWQHPTRHQLYGHLPPTRKAMQLRRTRHAGHCWRSKEELISDVLLWIPAYGQAKAGRPARTYIQQLCKDTGCSPEDLPEAMNDREKWRERVSDVHASGTTWWWWWWWWNHLHLIAMLETMLYPGYEMKLHIMERLYSWSVANVDYPFITITLSSTLFGAVVPLRSCQRVKYNCWIFYKRSLFVFNRIIISVQ